MGNVMGKCTSPCPRDGPQAGPTCPVADLKSSEMLDTDTNQCNCWQFSQATGAGFWQFPPCKAHQPLPGLWDDGDEACVKAVMDGWKWGAKTVTAAQYKFIST